MFSKGLIIGLIVFQVLFVLIQWYYFRRKEYFYYLLYIILIGLVFYMKYEADQNSIIHLPLFSFNRLYLDRPLSFLAFFCYIRFGRLFVDAAQTRFKLNKLIYRLEIGMLMYTFLDFSYVITTGNFYIEAVIFSIAFFIAFGFSIYIIIQLIIKNSVLNRFLVTGSLFVAFGAFLTLLTGFSMPQLGVDKNDNVFYMQMGVVTEFICLNLGLIYKSKANQDEIIKSQQKFIEKLQENEQLILKLGNMRSKISQDLHDEVGATLSGIALYSHLTKKQMDEQNPAMAEQSLYTIQRSAAEMVNRLSDIVWAVNPVHDNIEDFLKRLEEYSLDMSTIKNIQFRMNADTEIKKTQLSMEQRNNIYLICKEAINNSVKYSGASFIELNGRQQDGYIQFSVTDDGTGFMKETIKRGQGLNNMQKRADEIMAEFNLFSFPGKGTTVSVICKIT